MNPTPPEEWHQHWQSKGFSWRTEPEIDAKRQEELSKHCATAPDIKKGRYPFKGIKLSRADIEWLLAADEDRDSSSDWKHDDQWKREGLDLRGANLRGVNLERLPLRNLQGGLTWDPSLTDKQIDSAAVHLENADLSEAHLEDANFVGAHLREG